MRAWQTVDVCRSRSLLIPPCMSFILCMACGSDVPSATSSDGDNSSSETSASEDTQTSGDDPTLVADNCEVEVLWSYLPEGGLGGDQLVALHAAGPGAFVLVGLDDDVGAYSGMVLSVVDGVTAWSDVRGPASGSPYSKLMIDVSVADDGTIVVLGGGAFGRMYVYSSTGERLDLTLQLNSQWEAMVRHAGELRVIGTIWKGVGDDEPTLARFDEHGQLLETVAAPTVGIDAPKPHWATELVVDEDRVWVAGWDEDHCGLLVEYNAAGEQQWWDCAMLGEDGKGRLEAMASLSNQNLVMVGGAQVTKSGYSSYEPVISAWTRDGVQAWVWTNDPQSQRFGPLRDIAVLPDGGFVTVFGEWNYDESGARQLPVVQRHDDDGELALRCTLDLLGTTGEWEGELTQVVVGEGGEVVALLVQYAGAPLERSYSLVRVTGLE